MINRQIFINFKIHYNKKWIAKNKLTISEENKNLLLSGNENHKDEINQLKDYLSQCFGVLKSNLKNEQKQIRI